MSDLMLRVPLLILFSHQLTCLVLCLGLAGLAVGLGAWLPNLREESPSRIAAGFGGTLTLVSSTLFILFIVLLTALPTHFFLAAQAASSAGDFDGPGASAIVVSLVVDRRHRRELRPRRRRHLLPLRVGFRAFREMEF